MKTCCNCWSHSSVRCFRVSSTGKAAGRRFSSAVFLRLLCPRRILLDAVSAAVQYHAARFYVSEFGWVASLIFLHILQETLATQDERSFRSRSAWLAPAFGVPLLVFYCTFGDILSNLIWCGMMIWLSYCAIRGACLCENADGHGAEYAVFP